MTDLASQYVLVTGASTGIGAAAAIALAEAGADVGVHYHESEDAAREVAGRIEDLGRKAALIQADLRRSDEADRMTAEFIHAFGRVDVLFANAGALVRRSPIVETDDDLWREVYAVNVDSAFYSVRAALRHMLGAKRGNIIVNASVAARSGGGGNSVPYASAKGALLSFVRGLAKEVAADGVRINAVAPGVTETPFHEKFTEPERQKGWAAKIPLPKLGTPEDIARCVVWLAGETDGFITGETIYLAGGV